MSAAPDKARRHRGPALLAERAGTISEANTRNTPISCTDAVIVIANTR